MKKKILLFIPTYNCEKQISRVITKTLPYQGLFREILIVDNRSSDATIKKAKASILESAVRSVKVIKNNENYSLGGSHKVAFQYALDNSFDFVAVYHGDDQADILDLAPLIQKGLHLEYDCLLGSRFHKQAQLVGYSTFRTYGNILLNLVCNVVCRARISDQGSGLNFYSTTFLRDKRIWNFPDNLTFNVYLLYHAYFSGARVHFFPISWREEDQISNAKVFQQGWQILKLSAKTLLDRNKLYTTDKEGQKNYSYEIKH